MGAPPGNVCTRPDPGSVGSRWSASSWSRPAPHAGTAAGSRTSLASSSVTIRSCSSKSRRAARGLQRPRMVKMRTAKTAWPARHTVHQRFHSPGDVFWAGTSFCSATQQVAPGPASARRPWTRSRPWLTGCAVDGRRGPGAGRPADPGPGGWSGRRRHAPP